MRNGLYLNEQLFNLNYINQIFNQIDSVLKTVSQIGPSAV